ncbi:DUF4397 domain-containing protein [Micromonospora yangpuensis]|uniref:DUF4397 domain-containing protein n=1 Tax=Micromonospora yangpuensis TaxID=683228 RepID=A0A1C6UAS5_9ACTN|nr:DUF4397 domain-containing protein [Micromonospora yangpuensis]GGL87576.1 lipoprotein [Micromonospora yangpuensis]SCL51003.1 protein of unknown function [Micromonospora yangpuensis]
MSYSSVRRIAAGSAAALTFAGIAAFTATPAYAASAKVSVVHGIPDTPVDVYVNGEKTLENFKPGDVAGPLDLAEGAYDIALTKPGEPIGSAILSVDDAEVPGGANISIAAHLNAEGEPKITPFVNDTGRVDAGKARLVVRHTAAAPAVDVRAGGQPVFENLTNPNEAKGDVDAGTVNADVVLAGTDTVAIGPADLNLAEGTATIVYAIGSAEGENLSIVSQTITGLHSAPSGVPSGTGGQAATGLGTAWYVLAGAGTLLLIGGGARLATARPARR